MLYKLLKSYLKLEENTQQEANRFVLRELTLITLSINSTYSHLDCRLITKHKNTIEYTFKIIKYPVFNSAYNIYTKYD